MDTFQIVPQWIMENELSFGGSSIGQKMKESFFAKFNNMSNNLVSSEKIQNNLIKLPSIVVISAESSGKSSLLEYITKFPIFPM